MVANDLHIVSERLNETLSGFTTDPERAVHREDGERRDDPRIESRVKVSVVLDQGDVHGVGVSQDVSMSGMNLKSNRQLQRDASLQLTIHIPTDGKDVRGGELSVAGVVVRAEERSGYYYYGIRFEPLGSAQKHMLQSLFTYFGKHHSYA